MSSKEDKKKKKKGTKSKEPAEEQSVTEEVVKEAEPQKVATEVEEPSDVPEEKVTEVAEPEPVPASGPIAEPVEEARKPSRKESKKEDKKEIKRSDLEKLTELKEAFSLFDFNHDGVIDLQDLKYTFASLGRPDYPEEEMQKMLKEATQPCDFDAFVALFGYKVSTLDTEEVFTKALSTWDMRGIGMIPEDRFKRDIRCFGDKFTGKETDNALEEAPVYVNEGAPMIDYAKFSSNICGFRNVERTRKYQKEIEK